MADRKESSLTVPMSQEIDGTLASVDRKLSETDRKFMRCPKCGLPTHAMQDGSTAYCATCNEYYDPVENGTGRRKLEKVKKVTPLGMKIAGISSISILVLVIASLILAFVLQDTAPSYIDIDDVNEIRGLPVSNEVEKFSISPAELDERIRASIDEESRSELRDLEWIFKTLFIMPREWDLVEIVENQSGGDGIAGFYDTELKEMYIVGENHSPEYVNYILSHEFTHALQDQNFALDPYMEVDGYDQSFSRTCAIEGDAVLTMEKWADRNLNDLDRLMIQFEGIAQLLSTIDFEEGYSNEVLSEMSYFPYEGGYDFVLKVYEDGGYDAVNELFTTKPPLSSEQVLHYEKYLEYEEPVNAPFEGDTTGLVLEYSTTIGEKLLSEMLAMNGGYSMYGGQGAVGWGGDELSRYSSGSDKLSILVTRWDSTADNDNFSWAYERMLDNIGTETGDLVKVGGLFVYKESNDDTTIVYSSTSEELVRSYMG